jgi:hypothetical protein
MSFLYQFRSRCGDIVTPLAREQTGKDYQAPADDDLAADKHLYFQRLTQTLPAPTIELYRTRAPPDIIANNQLGLNAGWNHWFFRIELAALQYEDFDLSQIGFEDEEWRAYLRHDPETGVCEAGAAIEDQRRPDVTRSSSDSSSRRFADLGTRPLVARRAFNTIAWH